MANVDDQIRVRDTTGAYIAVFSTGGRGGYGGGLQSLNLQKRTGRTPGGWTARIFGNDERIDDLRLMETAPTHLDYIFEFWRRDTIAGLDWYRHFAGFHRWDGFSDDQEGREVYIASGRGFNDLCSAEVIRYAEGSAEACKGGAAETVAKEFVDENIGPGAAPAARQMPGLSVEASAGTGATWPATGDGCRANKLLMDVLLELAEFAPGDFEIVEIGDPTVPTVLFEFRWRDGQWGEDRTEGNTGGLPPIVFGISRGNMTNLQMIRSRLEEVNVVYVGGAARKANRAYVTRTAAAEGDSPWARRAVFRSAQGTFADDSLNAVGDAILNEQRARWQWRFDALQTAAIRYGDRGEQAVGNTVTLWDVGDLVTVEHRTLSVDQKIVGVHYGVSSDGTHSIQPEITDA